MEIGIQELEGKILRVYPARVKFRGFPRASTQQGYDRLTQYMSENIKDLMNETQGEDGKNQ